LTASQRCNSLDVHGGTGSRHVSDVLADNCQALVQLAKLLEGTWQAFGGGVPWRTTDPQQTSKPVTERQDSTNSHYAQPAMARYLCAEGAGTDLWAALFAYNHADWYVSEIIQLAAG